MKTIEYKEAKKDNTLYRYKGAFDKYQAVVVMPDGKIRYTDITPTTDMPILKNIPNGTKAGR